MKELLDCGSPCPHCYHHRLADPHGPDVVAVEAVEALVADNSHHMVVVVADNFPYIVVVGNCFPRIAVEDSYTVAAVEDNLN